MRDSGYWLRLATCVVVVVGGLFAGTAHAQSSGNRMSSAPADTWEKKSPIREELNTGGSSAVTAEPYGGQIYCPITGAKLGLSQPAIPVQTSIGATNLGAIAMFGKKATPGGDLRPLSDVHAVRQNPERYLAGHQRHGVALHDHALRQRTTEETDRDNADSAIQPAAVARDWRPDHVDPPNMRA